MRHDHHEIGLQNLTEINVTLLHQEPFHELRVFSTLIQTNYMINCIKSFDVKKIVAVK